MNRPLIWLLLFVLLAGTAVFVYMEMVDESDEVSSTSTSTAADDDSSTLPLEARRIQDAASRPTEPEGAPSGIAQPAPPPETDAPAGRRKLLVRVLDQESKKPISGARVFIWQESPDLAARIAAFMKNNPELRQDPVEFVKRISQVHTANDDGEVTLWIAAGRAGILADGPTYQGRAEIKAQGEGIEQGESTVVEVEAFAKTVVHVRIEDQQGDPVEGVFVSCSQVGSRGRPAAAPVNSDEDGRLVIEFSPAMFQSPRRESLPVIPYELNVESAFESGLTVSIEETTSLEKPQVIRLPDFGWVALTLLGVDGQVLDEPMEIKLTRRDRNPAKRPSSRPTVKKPTLTAFAKNGKVRMGPVGLGLEFEGLADPAPDGSVDRKAFEVTGPRAPGGTVEQELRWSEAAKALTGRLVGPGGKPLANRLAGFYLVCKMPEWSDNKNDRVMTDEAGVFRLKVRRSQLARMDNAKYELRVSAYEVGRPRDELSLRLDITDRLRSGQWKMGDLQLERPPMILSGIVVDTENQPVSGAHVGILVERESGGRKHYTRKDGDYRARASNQSGAFQLHGVLSTEPDEQLVVEANHPSYLTRAKVPFTVGQTDLRVVVERAGAFMARMDFGDASLPETLLFVLQDEGPDVGLPRNTYVLDEDHVIELRTMLPGSYTLRIFTESHLVMFERPGIVIKPGETTDLGRVKVSTNFYLYEFEFVDQTGAAVDRVVMQSSGTPAGSPGFQDFARGSEYRVHRTESSLRLRFSKGGYLDVEREILPGKTRIVLQAFPKVKLRFRGTIPFIQDDERLLVHLMSTEGGSANVPGILRGNGEVLCAARALGKHRIIVRLMRSDENSTRSKALNLDFRPGTIKVSEAADQVFDLELPDNLAAEIEAARAEWN